MNHLQADTLIAAWRDDAETARKAGHKQTAREIEAAAGLFERQAAEIKTLRENNAALQAELDDGHAELRDERDALAAGLGQMLEARSAFMGSRSSSADSFSAFLEAARDVEDATTAILARRDARMKAEAFSQAADMARDESWQLEHASFGTLKRDLLDKADEYRKQAEGEAWARSRQSRLG